MVAASSFSTAPVKEGEVLDAKYRIEQVIGMGGMGIVVSAMHLELDKRVALKFLLPQAQESDELIGRFMREARSSVKLKGPHVARTLDVGRMEDGRAFIVMEYLEGLDLGQAIKANADKQFPVADGVSWILQACEGLAEAHALGIVHRDLKPANLFLQRDNPDDPALVKVLDFGISKSINPSSSDHLSLTKTEMLLGSPLYMAPEQMRSSKYVDERSDIWSLGAVAYEILASRVPFEAETLLDLCFRVAQEDCVPLSVHRPDVPAALSDAVMRCLEKDPDKRWRNVGELAVALEPFGLAAQKGSGARTAATLAAGDPSARTRAVEAYVPQVVDPTRKTGSKAVSRSGTRTVVHQDDQVTTGSSPTERAPNGDDEPIPPSRALHPMPPEEEPAPSKMRTPMLIVALGLAVLVVSYALSRSARTTPPPPPAPTVLPEATNVNAPPPPATTTQAPPTVLVPLVAPSSATPTPSPAPAPRPRPKPSATPAASSSSSSGFLKVRE